MKLIELPARTRENTVVSISARKLVTITEGRHAQARILSRRRDLPFRVTTAPVDPPPLSAA